MIAQLNDFDQINHHFPDACLESNGSVTFTCPVCEAEGHAGKRVRCYRDKTGNITGVSCARFASAGVEANRIHCAPIREQLGLLPDSPRVPFVQSTLFDGNRRVTLRVDPAPRNRHFVSAQNCTATLGAAEINLAIPAERAEFVASLVTLTDEERSDVSRELPDLLVRFRETAQLVEDAAGDAEDERKSAATLLIELASQAALFHDPDGDGYAVLNVCAHKETWPLKSRVFKRWLAREYYLRFEKAAPSQALSDALGVIEGKALWEGAERQVFTRLAEYGGKIYLDMCDADFRAVEVDEAGWRIVPVPPVEFRRSRGALPLPEPVRGGTVDELKPFLNIERSDWVLVASFIAASLRPRGPFPVLVLNGGQGTAKTTTARVIRCIVDPHSTPLRSEPREERDLMISARNSWITALDNLSRLPQWLSDALCRLSTGGGLSVRQLYSDDDEQLFSVMRPAILTSIEELATRPDLLERSIVATLPLIGEKARVEEKAFWEAFEQARPRILGAFLDVVSAALRKVGAVRLERKPRMADFAIWSTACEEALGEEAGAFMRAYFGNVDKAADIALEASPVAEAVMEFAAKYAAHEPWVGMAKQLHQELTEMADETERKRRKEQGWPATPKGLSGALRRLEPSLRSRGVLLTFNLPRTDKKGSRLMKIELDDRSPEGIADSPNMEGAENASEPSDRQRTPQTQQMQQRFSDTSFPSDAHSCVSDAFSAEPDSTHRQTSDASLAVSEDSLTHPPQTTVREETIENNTFASELRASDGSDAFSASFISPVAIDTETQPFTNGWEHPKTWRKFKALGQTPITPHNARMIGLAVAYSAEHAEYITDAERWPLEATLGEGQQAIFFNYKFEAGVMERAGLPLPDKWECGSIAARLVDENAEHGLKPLAKRLLGVEPMTYEEAEKMRLLDPEAFAEYARADATNTHRLWPLLKAELDAQELWQVYELEKRLLPVVRRMEEAGMRLNLEALEEAGRETSARLDALEEQIYAFAGCRWNLNAPHDTGTVLYTKLNLHCPKETRSGQPSVDAEALEELAGQHPVVAPLIEYREINKLAKAFIETLPVLADENGRVHPHYNQLGADTGRFTCRLPNLQQIPKSGDLGKRLRQAFIADEGNALVVADYSQQELRVLAHYSRDTQLIEAFQSSADLHTRTASLMFAKAEEAVTKEERAVGKLLNFGICYGISGQGLYAKLSHEQPGLTLKDCEQFIADYFRAYKGVKRLLDQVVAKARERGYVRTLLGRRRHLWAQNRREERQVCNSLIQGSAADITKTAMVDLAEKLPHGAQIVCCVHDELVIECPQGQAETVKELTVAVMRDAVPEGFSVPMLVDAKIGLTWGECK